jgi:hypothetical protein
MFLARKPLSMAANYDKPFYNNIDAVDRDYRKVFFFEMILHFWL